MKFYYLKYQIPTVEILEKLENKPYNQIVFYIDLLSISRGFYNKQTIDMEIGNYLQTKTLPELYIAELKEFLNKLYLNFRKYTPKFVLFYDGGKCIQNTSISKEYKASRASDKQFFLEEEKYELIRRIKSYYLSQVREKFNKKGLSCVIYSDNYEMDLLPHLVISKNMLEVDDSTLNVILSVDKDMLQSTSLKNTVVAVSVYKKSEGKIEKTIYDNKNSLSYIYPGFKAGGLTSDYIPLILALSGDAVDGIENIKGCGVASAVKLINMYNLPISITENMELPPKLKEEKQKIVKNFKMTDFNQQISRLPDLLLYEIESKIKEIFLCI